jgi:hypothetical protein
MADQLAEVKPLFSAVLTKLESEKWRGPTAWEEHNLFEDPRCHCRGMISTKPTSCLSGATDRPLRKKLPISPGLDSVSARLKFGADSTQ